MFKNNCFCFVQPKLDSSSYQIDTTYQENYIISQNVSNIDEFKKAINNSLYATYIKNYNVSYYKEIMKIIDQTTQNLYDNV